MPSQPSPRPTRLSGLLCSLSVAAAVQGGIDPLATVIYVDDTAPPAGDGESWATAFRDLQSALDVVNSRFNGNIEVRVAAGLYSRNPSGQHEYASFHLNPPAVTSAAVLAARQDALRGVVPLGAALVGSANTDVPRVVSGVAVRIVGGFAGFGAPLPDDRDPAAFVSVLSGDLSGNDADFIGSYYDNAPVVLRCLMPIGTRLDVDGLVLRSSYSGSRMTACLLVRDRDGANTPVKIDNCRFDAARSGGVNAAGLWLEGVTAWINDSAFFDNRVGYGHSEAAPLVFIDRPSAPASGRTLWLSNCAFDANAGTASGGVWIKSPDSWVTIEQSAFTGNRGQHGGSRNWPAGGAVTANESSYLRIWASVFTGNSSISCGAVSGRFGSTSNSDFHGNSATGGDGGAVRGVFSIHQSDFIDNSAIAGRGGALAGVSEVYNSTFVNNTAQRGGAAAGILGMNGQLEFFFERCRFEGNTAMIAGGAVHSDHYGYGFYECSLIDNHVRSAEAAYGGAAYGVNIGVTRTRLLGNTAESINAYAGGGAVFAEGAAWSSNSVYSGNASIGTAGSFGGAVLSAHGGSTILSTLFANRADSTAGIGIGSAIATGFGLHTVTSGVLWRNSSNGVVTAPNQVAPLYPAFPPAVRYCVVDGLASNWTSGTFNTGADPRLADPAGPDAVPGTVDDNLRIASVASPCIDAAEPGLRQDWNNRLDADSGSRQFDAPVVAPGSEWNEYIDRGAYEYRGNARCLRADVTGDGSVTTSDISYLVGWFGRVVPTGSQGDLNLNGVIDTPDLRDVLGVFGCTRWSE